MNLQVSELGEWLSAVTENPQGAPLTNGRTAIADILTNLSPIEAVIFAVEHGMRPNLACQVPFPRVGFVISGTLEHVIGASAGRTTRVVQTSSTALFVPADGWNDPHASDHDEVVTLDLVFGKQRLGFALTRWNGDKQTSLGKYAVPRRGPRVGTFILQTLGELALRPQDTETAVHLVHALVSHARDLMQHIQVPAGTRGAAFFEAIREHIEGNYAGRLTRESVADAFEITPNYLSHLFQKEIRTSFNDYVNSIRLEQAKQLLRHYDISIKEVAARCGFADSNYFCRLFRRRTDRSPTEYRMHYHSRAADV